MRRVPPSFSLLLLLFLLSCTPAVSVPSTPLASASAFYIFRLNPPALVEISPPTQPAHVIPVTIPAGCSLDNLFPPRRGSTLAMELACPFGQAVVWVNTDNGEIRQAVSDSDSHFLAWTADGQAAYLKVDTLSNPHIVLAHPDGKQEFVPVTALTYDLAPASTRGTFAFTFSRGIGFGSEMWLAKDNGNVVRQMLADKNSIISFGIWSPSGERIAFIKIPDSQTPFTEGELWVMDSDGSNAHKLAEPDAGHGFAPAWSADGLELAFVGRENPQDANADRVPGALISNISIVELGSGKLVQLTHFQGARVEEPVWSPEGGNVAFTVVLNDKMNVYLASASSGTIQMVSTEAACCPVWIRK